MLDKIDIEDIKYIAVKSGNAVLNIYNQDFDVEYKDDNSPVTKADLEANRIILEGLTKLYLDIPILSEETDLVDYEIRKHWEYYWCIDPLDGTKEFVKRNGEFTINIGLIHKGNPVLGVVFAPMLNELYYAKKGYGAFKNGYELPFIINDTPKEYISVASSRSHKSDKAQKFIDNLRNETEELIIFEQGSSLKFCLLAEGMIDIYPRFSPIQEWDTAASHCILLESGKNILNYETGKQITYNKKSMLQPWFIAK